MSNPSLQVGDVMLDGRPYMLPEGKSGRVWEEEHPDSAEIREQKRDVARGAMPMEFRISWDTKHRGYGEPYSRFPGRDYYGQNVDKRYPNQVILARGITEVTPTVNSGGNPVGMTVLGSTLYVADGRYVVKYNVSTEAETGTPVDQTTTTDICTFNNKIFLAKGNSTVFSYSSDGTTFTPHAALTAYKFQPAENRLYRLCKSSTTGSSQPVYLSNNYIDPTDNLNWSAEDPIGDIQVPGTGLASLAYQIFVAKEDGLYAADIETGRFPSLTPELAPWRDSSNGVAVTGWGGMTFLPTIRGLKMFFAGTLATVGPELMAANDSEVKGRITAMTGDANWLYAALYNGTNTYILAGRPTRNDDAYPGEITWSVVWYLTGGPWSAMDIVAVSGVEPKLVVAKNNKVAFIRLGTALDNPLTDSTAIYSSTATDYYPAHDAGSPLVDKRFTELRVTADNLSQVGGRYIEWYYRLDDTAAWTYLGKAQTSPVSVLKFDPAVNPIGKRVQLKAVWTRGATTTATPVLRTVEVQGFEFPPAKKVIGFTIMAEDNTNLRQGIDTRRWHEIVKDLTALERKVVPLVDPAGRKYTVLVLPFVKVKEVGISDTRGYSVGVTVNCVVL